MEIKWIALGVVAVLVILLISYVVSRNRKEQKDLEMFLNNNDYQSWVRDESELDDENK